MVRVETPRMSARCRAVIFPRACSSSVIANNRSVFSMIFILTQKNVKRVTDICHVFSVRLKIPTRGMEASQSQASRQGWPGGVRAQHRPAARGGPTIYDAVGPLVEGASLVGPPLAAGLPVAALLYTTPFQAARAARL